jgi:hypothetical protein
MLRWLVVALLVLNGLFFAWTLGWLDGVVGVPADGDREPERLARQFQAERIRIVTAQGDVLAAPSAPTPTPAGLVCLETGPYSPDDLVTAQAALATVLPPQRWTVQPIERPGAWLVYLGRYANRESMVKRQQDLRQSGIAAQEVLDAPELALGLSLGRFNSRAEAETAQQQLTREGVRASRVVAVAPAVTEQLLRIDRADVLLVSQLLALSSDAVPRGFTPCSTTSAASAPR